jgi:hypothetical protein
MPSWISNIRNISLSEETSPLFQGRTYVILDHVSQAYQQYYYVICSWFVTYDSKYYQHNYC